MSETRWLLIDSASLYFRAYFGVPTSLRDDHGRPINAAHGFLDMLTTLVRKYEPTEMVCAWDDNWRPAWRVELVPSYKTHRVAGGVAEDEPIREGAPAEELVDEELAIQVPVIRQALEAVGLPIVGHPTSEADDVLGTFAARASAAGEQSIVVTGDRDLFQLIDDHCRVAYIAKGVRNHELADDAWLAGKYGIIGAQYADFATMRGDASDGLPGVPGVGEKTAANLLASYGDLEGIVAAANDPATKMAPGLRSKITAQAEYIGRALQVVQVRTDLPVDVSRPTIHAGMGDPDAQRKLGAEWNLDGALERLTTALAENLS